MCVTVLYSDCHPQVLDGLSPSDLLPDDSTSTLQHLAETKLSAWCLRSAVLLLQFLVQHVAVGSAVDLVDFHQLSQ